MCHSSQYLVIWRWFPGEMLVRFCQLFRHMFFLEQQFILTNGQPITKCRIYQTSLLVPQSTTHCIVSIQQPVFTLKTLRVLEPGQAQDKAHEGTTSGVCNRWTGPLDWTTGLDYWTDLAYAHAHMLHHHVIQPFLFVGAQREGGRLLRR